MPIYSMLRTSWQADRGLAVTGADDAPSLVLAVTPPVRRTMGRGPLGSPPDVGTS